MNNELKEYCCKMFNFSPDEEWDSLEGILEVGRKAAPCDAYSRACMGIAEKLARHVDRINPPEEKWVNVYIGEGYVTKTQADIGARENRIACIKFTEGEGL